MSKLKSLIEVEKEIELLTKELEEYTEEFKMCKVEFNPGWVMAMNDNLEFLGRVKRDLEILQIIKSNRNITFTNISIDDYRKIDDWLGEDEDE